MTQKILDEKKICFIIAVNDEEKFASCVDWIKKLKVPRGIKLSVQAMRGFSSMTNAYQVAMEQSDAKYKIYIHQDVYCIYKNMLEELVKVFRKYPRFGLIGLIGTKYLPNNAVWWNSLPDNKYGMIGNPNVGEMEIYRLNKVENEVEEVEAVDGVFLATQYDVDWRTDLFDHFHFYDISQCKEFNRAGYEVGIVRQEEPWCHHYNTEKIDVETYDIFKYRFFYDYWWGMKAENTAPTLERKPLTDIVILSYNTLDMMKLCIESIRRYTEPRTYQIIVIDNASTDGSVEYLKEQTDIKCVFNEENAGFSKGCNQGIELATGMEILVLNSNTIVTPRWLAQLRYALYKDKKTGAVSCVNNKNIDYLRVSGISYTNLQEMWKFADSYNKTDENKWLTVEKINNDIVLLKCELAQKITESDECWLSTDSDNHKGFCLNKKLNEYEYILCTDTFVHQT